jgi:hypothetical protein
MSRSKYWTDSEGDCGKQRETLARRSGDPGGVGAWVKLEANAVQVKREVHVFQAKEK